MELDKEINEQMENLSISPLPWEISQYHPAYM